MSQLVRAIVSLVLALAATGQASPARPIRPSASAVDVRVGSSIQRSERSTPGESLSLSATTASSASLAWSAVPGAASYQILREGRLIDDVEASVTSYTDWLLWPATAYAYEVDALDATGAVLARLTASGTTSPLSSPVPVAYAPTSFWNQPIGRRAALDPTSRVQIGTSIKPYANLGVLNNNDDWGIPIAYADPASEDYDVGCTKFNCVPAVSFRIPRYAQVNHGSDGHLAVYDPTTNQELDLWQGTYEAATDTWSASGRTATPADWGAACAEGTRCGGGGTAAGFLEFGGVIRPEEILQGHIDHALVLSGPWVRADAISCPATNYWASQGPTYHQDPNAISLGAHVQLDPRIDVGAKPWPTWEKVVAKALQTYGAYVADVSSSLELRGEANLDRGYDAWSLVGMSTQPSLANLPWGRMRVLASTSC